MKLFVSFQNGRASPLLKEALTTWIRTSTNERRKDVERQGERREYKFHIHNFSTCGKKYTQCTIFTYIIYVH
jgi:hypothetical protein